MDHFHKCMLLVANGMLWFQHLKQHISKGFQQVSGCSLWWLLVCQWCHWCQWCPPAASCGSWCASVVPLLARARCVLPPIPVSVRGRRERGQLAGKLIFSFFLQKILCHGFFTKSWTPIWFCWAQVIGLCHVRCAQLPEGDLTSWPGRVWQSSGWSVVPLSSLPWVSSSAFSL